MIVKFFYISVKYTNTNLKYDPQEEMVVVSDFNITAPFFNTVFAGV